MLHESADVVEREDAEAVDPLGLEVVVGGLDRMGEGGEGVGGEFWVFGGAAGGDVDRLDGDFGGWGGWMGFGGVGMG